MSELLHYCWTDRWVGKVKNKKLAALVGSTQKRETCSHLLRSLLGKHSFFNFISYKPSFLLHRLHKKTESAAPDLFLTSESLPLNSRFCSSVKNYILLKYILIDNNRKCACICKWSFSSTNMKQMLADICSMFLFSFASVLRKATTGWLSLRFLAKKEWELGQWH